MKISILFIASSVLMLCSCDRPKEKIAPRVACIGVHQKALIRQTIRNNIIIPSDDLMDLDSLSIEISSIRTIEADDRHALCEAELKGTILPTDLGRKYLYGSSFRFPETDQVDNVETKITSPREISYTIRPSDDGKEMFLEDARGFQTKAQRTP